MKTPPSAQVQKAAGAYKFAQQLEATVKSTGAGMVEAPHANVGVRFYACNTVTNTICSTAVAGGTTDAKGVVRASSQATFDWGKFTDPQTHLVKVIAVYEGDEQHQPANAAATFTITELAPPTHPLGN
jgi:hypothetical protein